MADDKKQIVNMLYHAGVETILTVGYSELGRKLFKKTTKIDFNFSDIGMLSLEILLAMITKDTLVRQGIIPADIMK